ncbi:MAG: MBG domain-containing protein [Bacteroidales bacterium]
MKKKNVLILSALAGGFTFQAAAQDQLANSGFEIWETKKQSTIWVSDGLTVGEEPVQWNSFLTAGSFFSPMTTLFHFANNQLAKSDDVRPGSAGLSSARLFSTEIMGIVANGNLTTGTIHMGSMTPSDPTNYNFTDTRTETVDQENGIIYDPAEHRVAFTGRPDSVEIWTKFAPTKYGSVVDGNTVPFEAQLSFILHADFLYKEPHATDAEQKEHLIASAFMHTASTENAWRHLTMAMDYADAARNPAYLLASFTTNKNAGKGSGGDQLWVDDLHFIYNTKLRSIKVNGNLIQDFDEDTFTYYVNKAEGGVPALENIQAVPYGKAATVKKQQGEANEVLLIVTDETSTGEKTRTYTLKFVDASPVQLSLQVASAIKYAEVTAPVVTGIADLSDISYIISQPALMQVTDDGKLRAVGCGTVDVKAVYKEEGKPAVYSNVCRIEIQKLPLIIKSKNEYYKRGGRLPVYAIIYEGLLAQDQDQIPNIFKVAPSATSEVQKTSLPGEVFDIVINPGIAYNYEAVAAAEVATVTVEKADLKVTAKNMSRGEGMENPKFAYTYSGFVNGDKENTPGVLQSLPVITCDAPKDAKAGEIYNIQISGVTAALYNVIHVHGKLTIKKNPDALVVTPVEEQTYGNDQFTITATGGYKDAKYKYSSSNSKVISINNLTGVATIKGAGEAVIIVKVAETPEYMPATDTQVTVSVKKAPLTITAKSYTRLVGETNPEFELEYAGFAYEEDAAKVFPTLPVAVCTADENSGMGNYPIEISPVTAANYDVKLVNGVLTVSGTDAIDTVGNTSIAVFFADGAIRIKGNVNNELVSIFDIAGRIIARSNDAELVVSEGIRPNELYLIKVGNETTRVLTK